MYRTWWNCCCFHEMWSYWMCLPRWCVPLKRITCDWIFVDESNFAMQQREKKNWAKFVPLRHLIHSFLFHDAMSFRMTMMNALFAHLQEAYTENLLARLFVFVRLNSKVELEFWTCPLAPVAYIDHRCIECTRSHIHTQKRPIHKESSGKQNEKLN